MSHECHCGCHPHHGAHHHEEHHHEHHHEHGEKSLRRQWAETGLAAALLAAAIAVERWLELPTWQLLLVYLVPYLFVGWGTLREAWEGIREGDAFNENLLMAVATAGALGIGFLPGAETEFAEAVFVMLFFRVGELFEAYAEGQSRRSIRHLTRLRPSVAHTDAGDVAPEDVAVGTVVIVRPGERIPLDGTVVEGRTSLDTSALTGESVPRSVGVGDGVQSGCVNLSGVLRLRTTKAYEDSAVQKIIHLMEHAADRKSRSEAFITRFARRYTPVVVALAVLLAVVPTLAGGDFPTWLYRALMFLVVSCPCALVISVPLTFFGGMGGASRKGILVKGGAFMDALARLDTVVFDKTGTLTSGQFAVTAVHPSECDERRLLHLAAHVEHHTTHPIGAALRAAFPEEATDGCRVADVVEVAGKGIRARIGEDLVAVGNTLMMDEEGAQWHACSHAGTIVHVAINGVYAGHIVISDMLKPDSAEALSQLRSLGVRRTVMLTGDGEEVAARVAGELGITEHYAGLMPAGKVAHVERMMGEKAQGRTLAFVGDGINDAPVLARADVGIAMGGLGSDAAIEAADVVLMDDHPTRIATAIRIARRTLSIARQNVVFAIGVKVAVLLLAALGIGTLSLAVFADVGVMVIAVLNAMRALSNKVKIKN